MVQPTKVQHALRLLHLHILILQNSLKNINKSHHKPTLLGLWCSRDAGLVGYGWIFLGCEWNWSDGGLVHRLLAIIGWVCVIEFPTGCLTVYVFASRLDMLHDALTAKRSKVGSKHKNHINHTLNSVRLKTVYYWKKLQYLLLDSIVSTYNRNRNKQNGNQQRHPPDICQIQQ